MSNWMSKARVVLALGLLNVARVIIYRLGVVTGLGAVRRIKAEVASGEFFRPGKAGGRYLPAVSNWQDSGLIFGYWPISVSDAPPDWFANPISSNRIRQPQRSWWSIPDFDPEVGDIKAIWELSRMDWLLAFAQRVRNGDHASLQRLNLWLSDWSKQNAPYQGPNWKCGQEASIRVLHLAVAALILDQAKCSSPTLLEFVRLHLQRIAPTIGYAVAQDNNHGTSEAAALYVGGSWLMEQGVPDGRRWMQMGKRWLENRASRLVGVDGSFSQYSLNYHRLMLDTFCLVEVWRRDLGLPALSACWFARAQAAARWLYAMIDVRTGDGPNIGANDGARIIQLTNTGYRDFRPAVQLAMALFANACAFPGEHDWNSTLHWLNVAIPNDVLSPSGSQLFDDGGYAVLVCGDVKAVLRYPRFKFRPSHADALHLDLWVEGINVLRDGGTYSYNTDKNWLSYFPGTASHNTIQFDERDQMPRLSRFLFGDWLQTAQTEALNVGEGSASFAASYQSKCGILHRRHVILSSERLKVSDVIEGFRQKAVLRWRLSPGGWRKLGDAAVTDGFHVLQISASQPIVRCEIVDGWESRFYFQKTSLPVLEVEFDRAGTITSEYCWQV